VTERATGEVRRLDALRTQAPQDLQRLGFDFGSSPETNGIIFPRMSSEGRRDSRRRRRLKVVAIAASMPTNGGAGASAIRDDYAEQLGFVTSAPPLNTGCRSRSSIDRGSLCGNHERATRGSYGGSRALRGDDGVRRVPYSSSSSPATGPRRAPRSTGAPERRPSLFHGRARERDSVDRGRELQRTDGFRVGAARALVGGHDLDDLEPGVPVRSWSEALHPRFRSIQIATGTSAAVLPVGLGTPRSRCGARFLEP